MKKKRFGRTNLNLSLLTFGCGAVGGLMTEGRSIDQDRAVAWARDNGINHFDTAPSYGNTRSEKNLGRALGRNREGLVVSTKVSVGEGTNKDLAAEIRGSLESSLRHLRQDCIDIFQLHNTVDESGKIGTITAERVLNDVIPSFLKMREEGKTRYLGFTAKGDTGALHSLIKSGHFDSAQVFFNILVPSAGEAMPSGYPAQNYRQILNLAKRFDVGSIGVRVLAGGAASGTEKRHPLGIKNVEPIGSNSDYASDVRRALSFRPLVVSGYVENLTELAIRYAISNSALSTTEIGIATLEELQQAVHAVNKGPLTPDSLVQIRKIQVEFTK